MDEEALFCSRISNQISRPIFYVTPYIGAPTRGARHERRMRHACMCVGPVCKALIFSLLPHCQEETNSQQKPTTNIKQPTKNNSQQKTKKAHIFNVLLFFAVFYLIFIKLNVFFGNQCVFYQKGSNKSNKKTKKIRPRASP